MRVVNVWVEVLVLLRHLERPVGVLEGQVEEERILAAASGVLLDETIGMAGEEELNRNMLKIVVFFRWSHTDE